MTRKRERHRPTSDFTLDGNRVWRLCVRCGCDMEPDTKRRACHDCRHSDSTYVKVALDR